MKKHTILFAILMVTSILNAQLKVNSSGNTEIGSNITTSGKFNVKGNSYLEGRTELSGGNIIINGTTAQSGPALHLLASNGYPGMFLSATSSFNCSYILAVGGAITATSLYLSSDQQLKKNISALDGKLMLSKIMNLDGKKYEFISNEEIDRYYKELNNEASYSMKPSNLPKGEHYGFIAQDMEKEFPELVRTDSITKLKAIDYQGLVPVLLQSIKEQQNQINLLQETVNSLLASGKQKESAPLAPGKNTQLPSAPMNSNQEYIFIP